MNESFQTESLGKYGKIIREYEGKGLLTLYDGQTCNCSVRAVQLANGHINASCSFSENLNLVLSCWDKGNTIKSIKGITDEGNEVLLEKNIWCTSVNPRWNSQESTMVVRAGSIQFKKKNNTTPSSIRFGITNLEYLGNKSRDLPNGGWSRDILVLNLDGKTIEIHEVQDHKTIMESVIAQRGIDVTSEAFVNISSMTDLDTVIPVIDTLCKLLSLARGTKINWIYYDCYDSIGNKIISFHRSSIVWRYAGLPLIDYQNPNETATFLEQVYPLYLSLKEKYGLENAIEAYLDAKREGVYLETRALVASVLLEYLSDKYVGKDGEFRKNLETTLKGLGISASEDDLIKLKNIRNSLAHTASFIGNISEEHIQDYNFLIGTLDRIFLKILNYNGAFLDIANKFARINSPS